MITLRRSCSYTACLVAAAIITATPCTSFEGSDQEIYRCNAPSGYSDAKGLSMSSSENDISGKISLHSAEVGPDWASVGQILVHQHGAHYTDGDCGCNGIAVYAFKNPDHVEFYMAANGTDVPIADSPYDTPISFRVSISPQGVMTVAIGKTNPQIKTLKLLHPEHDTLEMSCSGADVSFLGIAIV